MGSTGKNLYNPLLYVKAKGQGGNGDVLRDPDVKGVIGTAVVSLTLLILDYHLENVNQ